MVSPKPIKGAAARIETRPYLTDFLLAAVSAAAALCSQQRFRLQQRSFDQSHEMVGRWRSDKVWFMHCFVRQTGRDGIMFGMLQLGNGRSGDDRRLCIDVDACVDSRVSY